MRHELGAHGSICSLGVCCTFSIGAMTLLKGVDKKTGTIPPQVEETVMNEVRAAFKPELLNRLDGQHTDEHTLHGNWLEAAFTR